MTFTIATKDDIARFEARADRLEAVIWRAAALQIAAMTALFGVFAAFLQ